MKKVKGLSVVMAALLAVQGGMNPAVFATNSKKEMNEKIQNQFLQTIFFRQDLIGKLKQFLPNNMKEEDIPKSFRTPEFLKLLRDNGILEDGSKEERKEEFEEEKAEVEQSPQQYTNYIKKIIEEDDLELLKKEAEKENFMNTRIKGSLFESQNEEIPILQYCVMKKAIKCFKFLLLNGANPSEVLGGNSKYKDWDCMIIAICFGEWEMMKILEERGIKKETNLNVWEAAALTHRNNILKLFISKKDEINNDVLFQECLNKAMFGVSKGNNLKGLKLLLKEGVDINARGMLERAPLHYAAENNALQVAKVLISKGADIDAKDNGGWTPLHFSAEKDANEVANLLISKGADIDAKDIYGRTSLHIAIEKGANEIAEMLINRGTKINVKDNSGWTPLHYAAFKDAIKVAELLISKGADIDAKGDKGRTPLFGATSYNADKVAELLISKGADVNVKDENGLTPLVYAAASDNIRLATLLISGGAHIDARDNVVGWTPLHYAACEDAITVAELLISKGADINAKDRWGGGTPLHYAAIKNSNKVAELLMSKGVDINVKDKDGRTPLDVAKGNVATLIEKKSKQNSGCGVL